MAEAAESAGDGSSELCETECSVCHDFFREPRLLPCGHLLCRECLLATLKSETTPECLLCRHIIMDPGKKDPRQCLEALADSLIPPDLAMAGLAEADRLLIKPHKCCICDEMMATSLCLNCGDLFCYNCKKIHAKQKVSMHHEVQEISVLTVDKLAFQRPTPCPGHADQLCEVFCPSHEEAMCHICAKSRHCQCPDLTDLQRKAEESRGRLVQMAATLKASERELDLTIHQLDKHLHETVKKTKESVEALHAVCTRLKSAIDACDKRAQDEAESALLDISQAVIEGKGYLSARRKIVARHKKVLERVLQMKKREAIITMTSLLSARIGGLNLGVTLPDNAMVICRLALTFEPEMVNRLERELSHNLAQVICDPAGLVCCEAKLCRCNRAELCFHQNHGKNIRLSWDKKTAERIGGDSSGGIVVGCQPMKVDMLYQVRLDKKITSTGHYMYVGALDASPETLDLPDASTVCPSAIVICANQVIVNGNKITSAVGKKLRDLPVKSMIGILLDEKRALHFYLDGEDQGVAATNLPDPCYPFFELFGPYKQMTALPLIIFKSV